MAVRSASSGLDQPLISTPLMVAMPRSLDNSKVTSVWVMVFAMLSKKELARLQTTCRQWCIEGRQAWKVVYRGCDIDRLYLQRLVSAANNPKLSLMLPNTLIEQAMQRHVIIPVTAEAREGKEEDQSKLPPSHEGPPEMTLRNLDPIRDSVAKALLNIWLPASQEDLDSLEKFLNESGSGMPYMSPLLIGTFSRCHNLKVFQANPMDQQKAKAILRQVVYDLCLTGEVEQAALIAKTFWNDDQVYKHEFSMVLLKLWRSGHGHLAKESFRAGMEQVDISSAVIKRLIVDNLGHRVDELIEALPTNIQKQQGIKYKIDALLDLGLFEQAREAASTILDDGSTVKMIDEALKGREKVLGHLALNHFSDALNEVNQLEEGLFAYGLWWLGQYCWQGVQPSEDAALMRAGGQPLMSTLSSWRAEWKKTAEFQSSQDAIEKSFQQWLSSSDIEKVIEPITIGLRNGDLNAWSICLSLLIDRILNVKKINKEKLLSDARIIAAHIPVFGFKLRAMRAIAEKESSSSSCVVS